MKTDLMDMGEVIDVDTYVMKNATVVEEGSCAKPVIIDLDSDGSGDAAVTRMAVDTVGNTAATKMTVDTVDNAAATKMTADTVNNTAATMMAVYAVDGAAATNMTVGTGDVQPYPNVTVNGNETLSNALGKDVKGQVLQEAKMLKTTKAPVQPDEWIPFDLRGNCHVIETDDAIYDAMLTQTNVRFNTNEFYLIQVLKCDTTNLYTLYRRWGTVGEKGETMSAEPYSSAHAPILEFEKIFYDKTKNHWSERKDFAAYPKCYTWLEIDYKRKDEVVEPSISSDVKRTFGPRVARFMSLICNFGMMTQQMTDIGYDAEKLPVKNLSKSTIMKAYEVLKLIAEIMGENNRTLLEELSGEFYTIIPHVFGDRKVYDFMINTPEKLRTKLEMVEALGAIENAAKLLSNCTVGQQEDIMFAQYQLLHCTLAPLASTTREFELIEKYMKNTANIPNVSQNTPDIVEIFKVSKEGENERFKKYAHIKNRMLLWHGSRLTNWLGILSEGLRIAPKDVPMTGANFGRGIYFADMFGKSMWYTGTGSSTRVANNPRSPTTTSRTAILLLCEVALGEMQLFDKPNSQANKLPKGKLSTKGLGQNAPSDYQVLDDGVIIPAGKLEKQQGGLSHNEYIVYNEDQVKMRYLVQVEYK